MTISMIILIDPKNKKKYFIFQDNAEFAYFFNTNHPEEGQEEDRSAKIPQQRLPYSPFIAGGMYD